MNRKCSKCFKKITIMAMCFHNSDTYHRGCCFICKELKFNQNFNEQEDIECKLCHIYLNDKTDFKYHQNESYCFDCFCKNFTKKCHTCSISINPNQLELEFGNDSYHKECFQCVNCMKKLDTSNERVQADEKTGKPCCVTCFNKMYRKICSKCSEIIKANQTGISYDTKAFHRECFSCFSCKTDLYDKQTGEKKRFFRDKNTDNPICETCFDKDNYKSCTNCKKLVRPTEKSFYFEKKPYHNDCFVCTNCSISLVNSSSPDNKPEIYKGNKNEPLCIDCYGKLNCKNCEKCSNLILPNQNKTLFEKKNYHKECFNCTNCNINLDVSTCVKDKKNKVICPECYAKIYSKKCKKCNDFILPEQSGLKFEDKFDFHRECFSCYKCERKLSSHGDNIKSDDTIYFKNENNLPICSDCYENYYCEKCHKCKKPMKSGHPTTVHEEKRYHSQCFVCSKCATKIVDVDTCKKDENNQILCQKCSKKKEKTPPRAKAGPGKLNFGQIMSFEKKTDFDCIKCKKKIMGQKFLTNKAGEFLCKKCHQETETSCFMCKKVFESREEFFKDDSNNNYCAKCIKIYRQNNKMAE